MQQTCSSTHHIDHCNSETMNKTVKRTEKDI